MIYLLFYDISEDRLRNKISKLLMIEGFERIQLSVYISLDDPAKNKILWKTIQNILSAEPTAKLYVISVNKNSFRHIKIIGNFGFDMEYLLGEKSSLTF